MMRGVLRFLRQWQNVIGLLLVGALQWLFSSYWYGLPGVAFAVAVLFYCWGPRDLDLDVDAIVDAKDPIARRDAAARLWPHDQSPSMDGPSLVIST